MPTTLQTPLRFGPDGRFELHAGERRLFVDGRQVALGARALDLLTTLAGQPDHLLSKAELLDRVWPGLVVEEANLQMQISNLRKLLGGDIIATVPGRGYRFV
ncbi:MAG: winged helix-turn-helix domain-containing protein, partial [Rubrivivax sp.]